MMNPNPESTGPPPPGPSPLRPSLGDALVVLGALMVFGFSFAPFVQYSAAARESLFALVTGVSVVFNAWSPQTFTVPLTTFVVAAALLSIAAVIVRVLLRREPHLVGFRSRQLEVGLALFAFLVLLGMVASDQHVIFGARRVAQVDPEFDPAEVTLDVGWGAVLMLIGAVLMVVGAVLNHFSIGPTVAIPGGRRPQSPPPAGGNPPPGGPPPPPPGAGAPPAGQAG